MSWSTPKTDWNGETVDGVYPGDRFNAVDFNRIKNNLESSVSWLSRCMTSSLFSLSEAIRQ